MLTAYNIYTTLLGINLGYGQRLKFFRLWSVTVELIAALCS